jgi:hypothetical protein
MYQKYLQVFVHTNNPDVNVIRGHPWDGKKQTLNKTTSLDRFLHFQLSQFCLHPELLFGKLARVWRLRILQAG